MGKARIGLWFLKAAGAAFLIASSGARADVVTDWNAVAANLPIAAPPVQARVMAAMHGAVFDAINSIDPQHTPYRFAVQAPAGASKEAAAAAAAHAVLSGMAPPQRPALDAELAASLGKSPDGQAKTDGVAVGKAVAEKMLAWRAADGFSAKASDNPGTAPGVWQRTPPAMAPGALPQLGAVTPFVLKSADQFPAKPRPALSSAEFARDFNEIKNLGGRNGGKRTADQTAVALFWSGNEVPMLNAAVRALLPSCPWPAPTRPSRCSRSNTPRTTGVRSLRSATPRAPATASSSPIPAGNPCSSPRLTPSFLRGMPPSPVPWRRLRASSWGPTRSSSATSRRTGWGRCAATRASPRSKRRWRTPACGPESTSARPTSSRSSWAGRSARTQSRPICDRTDSRVPEDRGGAERLSVST